MAIAIAVICDCASCWRLLNGFSPKSPERMEIQRICPRPCSWVASSHAPWAQLNLTPVKSDSWFDASTDGPLVSQFLPTLPVHLRLRSPRKALRLPVLTPFLRDGGTYWFILTFLHCLSLPRGTLPAGVHVRSDRAKWRAARGTDMCLSLHQTISPKSTPGQHMFDFCPFGQEML
jgi:hypothetical protein